MRSIKSLYGENLSQMSDKACATAIKNQARKGLKWFVSSEEKAILSILKEAEKHVVYNKSPDIENTPNMKKVERQLKILSDEIAKRTKKTDHIEAINNIRKVFVKMCLLSKVAEGIEIQRSVAFHQRAVERTATRHQHTQVTAAKGFQHNTQSVSDVVAPSSGQTLRQTFQDEIERNIKSLYGENLSQLSDEACVTAIRNQARKGLKWFVSSEEKAILSILKEAEKHVVYNKSPDIENTPNMKKVERQLKILSDEIAKRTKKTDHIEAINNIRKVFVKMCLLSKVEKRIEIQRFVAFYRLAVECTAAQQHQHAQVAAAKGFQHNTQSVSDVIVPSSAPIKNDAIPKKSIVGPAGSETMLHFFPFWPRKSDASKMIELTHKNHTSP